MDNLIIADPTSIFNLFGWGFLIGCMVTFVVMLGFECISRLELRTQKSN